MSVGQKLVILKIRSTSIRLLSLRNLEAAPEEAVQLRRLIKSSNESLGPYLFGKFEFWNFQGPRAEIHPTPRLQYLEKPTSNRVNEYSQLGLKPAEVGFSLCGILQLYLSFPSNLGQYTCQIILLTTAKSYFTALKDVVKLLGILRRIE